MSKQSRKLNELPSRDNLINPTFQAIQALGGSAKNKEILDKVSKQLNLSDCAIDMPHGNGGGTELDYRLRWARTYLKNCGIINNSDRGVWSVNSKYAKTTEVDNDIIVKTARETHKQNREQEVSNFDASLIGGEPEDIEKNELMPYRDRLYNVLIKMDPFAFERLSQRLLRECGFTDVIVTKKSKDGGIDGHGKLIINDIISFSVAFQCKRYTNDNPVSAKAIREFHSKVMRDHEKGVVITTSRFTKEAINEAQEIKEIDLLDGPALIDKLIEYKIGVTEVKDYVIDEDFFNNI